MIKRIYFVILTVSLFIFVVGCKPDYPNCKKDAHCNSGEYCINNLCQQCRDNGDCGEGMECLEGGCKEIPSYCASNSDCSNGQICMDNTCGPCMQNSDCDNGNVCADGLCIEAECNGDSECPAGLKCLNYKCQVDESSNTLLGDGDCSLEPVYFEFDSSEVSEENRQILEDNFVCLQSRGGKVTLEGHCDSLGTTEYNMALGERRSKIIANLLHRMGIEKSNMRVTSKGEEEAEGGNEVSRQRDRRVDFE